MIDVKKKNSRAHTSTTFCDNSNDNTFTMATNHTYPFTQNPIKPLNFNRFKPNVIRSSIKENKKIIMATNSDYQSLDPKMHANSEMVPSSMG